MGQIQRDDFYIYTFRNTFGTYMRTGQYYIFFIARISGVMNDEKNNANSQASISGIAIDTKA